MGILNGLFGFLGGFNLLFWVIIGGGGLFLFNSLSTTT